MTDNWNSLYRCRTSKGFTLMELMVAACLMMVAGVALAGAFHQGLRLWQRSERDFAQDQGMRRILDQIGRDFENALDVPGVAWSDDGKTVTFPIWRATQIFKITYHLEGPLKRDEVPLAPVSSTPPAISVLTAGPCRTEWDYAYIKPDGSQLIGWENGWKGGDALPAVLRVTLTWIDPERRSFVLARTFHALDRDLKRGTSS